MTTTVQGGYRVLRVGEICNLAALRRDKKISPLALRVYLGCHILAASRIGKDKRKFTIQELAQRIGGAGEHEVLQALCELNQAQVLFFTDTAINFSEKVLPEAAAIADSMGTKPSRPVPMPRYVLRALARHKRPVEVIAALAQLARLLFKKGAQIKNTGLVKASWIASVFSISERTVCAARQWLISMKILVPKHVNQFVLNRFGACFIVQLTQKRREEKATTETTKDTGASGEGERSVFADPLKRIRSCTSTSLNQNNYKPALSGKAGVSKQKNLSRPRLTNIQPEDLHRVSRLEELFKQATAANWLAESEANLRNFISAAIRATRASGDAVRIFVGIVKKGLFHHITQAEEDRAMQALKRYRDKKHSRDAMPEEKHGVFVSKLTDGLLQTVPEARRFDIEPTRPRF